MLSTVQIVTPPAAEPLSLDLVRQHCRIDHIADDELLAGYARAARSMAESYLGRLLITQTVLWTVTPENPLRPLWDHYLRGAMVLPRSPVQSIASVQVNDQRGNSTVIYPATLPIVPPAQLIGYRADIAHSPARLYIGRSTIMADGRELRCVDIENIQIEFMAGYADPTMIPQPILDAILLYTGFLYEHRGDAGADMPRAAEWLMDPYRLMWVA